MQTFATFVEARAAGLISTRETHYLCNKKSPLALSDTSGPNSFGYSYVVINRTTGEQIVKGVDCRFTDELNSMKYQGCYATMFVEAEVRAALATAEETV